MTQSGVLRYFLLVCCVAGLLFVLTALPIFLLLREFCWSDRGGCAVPLRAGPGNGGRFCPPGGGPPNGGGPSPSGGGPPKLDGSLMPAPFPSRPGGGLLQRGLLCRNVDAATHRQGPSFQDRQAALCRRDLVRRMAGGEPLRSLCTHC